MYQVIDTRTNKVVSEHTTRRVANQVRDRKDNTFGAYRYKVEFVQPKLSNLEGVVPAEWLL
jgi:hypothetical protein